MVENIFENRIKIQQIIENQLPEFILDESPKFAEFLKQYYISQEYQGAPVDISENIDQYLKLDNLTPEVIRGSTTLENDVTEESTSIEVKSTKGFPKKYGLFKIGNEIITYTNIENNTFIGCIRGFSGITNYHNNLNNEELIFEKTFSEPHLKNDEVINLSSLFLQEIYKKIKYTFTPGLENVNFVDDLNSKNFIKESISLYQSKGTEESFRILFNVLFGETPKIINLEDYLTKPSTAKYIRREVIVIENISGNPFNLKGQTIRKNNDDKTFASVSEVEIISRGNKNYYKLSLFVGYDDTIPTIFGNFAITGNTKVVEKVFKNSSVITVDSTIGFPRSGLLYCDDNIIKYENKSVNQFLGCTGIENDINTSSLIRSDETYYGYENGDITRKVEFRITGVLKSYKNKVQNDTLNIGDKILIRSLGEKIENPVQSKTKKELITNTWIYNTSSRFQIESFSNGFISQLILKESVDKSALKVGDEIEILNRDSEVIIKSNLRVVQITDKQINLSDVFSLNSNENYDIRRKIKKSVSEIVPIEYGNNTIISDIQNVYLEDDDYIYVASNSLPSYEIKTNIIKYNILSLSGFNSNEENYSIIEFSDSISFLTGDEVSYFYNDLPIPELTNESYYVEVLENKKQIRLYVSRSFIGSNNYVKIEKLPPGTHTFVLSKQKENIISPQKLLKKFPVNPKISIESDNYTLPGGVGMLVNGVEIKSYKSDNYVYYGPLESVDVLNGGDGYDIINPPVLKVSSGIASVQPIIRGSVKAIYVDPQDFDINTNISISITGGNGTGASFEPIIKKTFREIRFDARQITSGGGLDIDTETITFLSNHNLIDGEEIIYEPLNNSPLGVGTFGFLNNNHNKTLKKNSSYYTKVINNKTIQIYESLSDYNSGINTVGFTTIGNSGVHLFKTKFKNTLSEIKVINEGKNYENRKLIVKNTGISTANDLINFTNHGFNEGETIVYDYETLPIVGLSTLNQYKVIKLNDDQFRVSDIGIGGTNLDNYNRKNYVKFEVIGSGYHYFSYPKIDIKVTYSQVGVNTNTINVTPVIRGKIVGCYLYDSGQDYGSTVVNLNKKPNIIIKNGKNAQLKPIISNGRIEKVVVLYGGIEYYSQPSIKVIGNGSGAVLNPIINNGKIVSVTVVNSGANYSEKTSLIVESAGSGALLNPIIRKLMINKNSIYGDELLESSINNLQYSVIGYSNYIQNQFNDFGLEHSPIIGWSYDGNPIYGSYGYSNPLDKNSPIKNLNSGYKLNENNIINRPSQFELGFFVDDYIFDNSGDLDVFNGRYCVTPEFPNGVYAYFATSVKDNSGDFIGQFPYFIGDSYRSEYLKENLNINQDFDFNNSNLKRNTFPYRVSEKFSSNDFIVESSEIENQLTTVESITSGEIDTIEIVEGGDGYKIGDKVVFDETSSFDSSLSAIVSKVRGKPIESLNTTFNVYEDSVITWNNSFEIKITTQNSHQIENLDKVSLSGLSTNLSTLNGFYESKVDKFNTSLIKEIPSFSFTGIVTDIYVSRLSNLISIGSTLSIEGELFSVINLYPKENVIRVIRSSVGSSHTSTSLVELLPNTISIKPKNSIDYFESKLNDVYYFNPNQSVGVGRTVGLAHTTNYKIGDNINIISIPTQSIYIPNHKFNTNQKLILKKVSSASAISVANTEGSTPFNILDSSNSQIVYAIKKSNDHIGIVTSVGLTTNTNGLFFVNNGSDDYRYSIESDFTQEKVELSRKKTIVSLSTEHSLLNNDIITLIVKPNLSVGIGTSSSVYVKYNQNKQKILFDPILFSSSSINTSDSTISIVGNNLNTGDKVFYDGDSLPSGISTGFYYVYKVNNTKLQLCETYIDSILLSPKIIKLQSSGGSNQEISKVSPSIKLVKNNNLVFDTSDSSLLGYEFKIYYDENFTREFILNENEENTLVTKTGTVGLTSSSLTLKYSNNLPEKLFYSLEKNGVPVKIDNEVINSSQINFINSIYSGTYKISGVGTTTFNFVLEENPEKLSYNQSECDLLYYATKSSNDIGAVENISIISSGLNYKNIPPFIDINSEKGKGAYLIAKSKSIGIVKETKILNSGFDYSSDKTLNPSALLPSSLTIESSSEIESIDVISGGKNYITPPELIVIDSKTGKKINSGILSPRLFGNTISSVNIVSSPKGLPYDFVEIKSIKNTNGVKIQSVESSSSGIVTCYLVTPLNGFSIEPFEIGDKIFVEGIENSDTNKDGFNSENYGYKFFTVQDYQNSGTDLPRKLVYNISDFSTNIGIAKTIQESYSSIINEKNYPIFSVNQKYSNFIVDEKILVKNGAEFIETDIIVTFYNKNSIKVIGNYRLNVGDIILGKQSGSLATINDIRLNSGEFTVDYSYKVTNGWNDNVGLLNNDSQVIPDNDYYQNLSYSIKSSKQWEDIVTPVNNILHTSGLKNFSDTEIISSSSFGTNEVNDYTSTIYDIKNENRVDTINSFDFGLDVDVSNNSSEYIRLLNKKLSSYFELKTNRALQIDDISSEFSNSDSGVVLYAKIFDIINQERFNKFLVQIRNESDNQIQLTEIITINDTNNIYTLESGSITNKNSLLANIEGTIEGNNSYLKFSPSNPFDFDYEIKVLSTSFETFSSGISTSSIGFIDLIGFNQTISSGITTTIISKLAETTNSLYLNIQIIDSSTDEMNYVELYVDHDGTNTYTTEYYFDSNDGISDNLLGEFNANIDNNKLIITYTNNTSNNVYLRSKTVGFGSTSVGIGTYRFKKTRQLDGFERTVVYNSNYYNNISSPTTILSLDKDTFSSSKLTIRVNDDSQSSLHQVLFVHDDNNVYTTQYPYLSTIKSSGIGTFGGQFNGNNVEILFYPDNDVDGTINILSFSQNFYKEIDLRNIPPSLRYFSIEESVNVFQYFGVNNSSLNKNNFELTYLGDPIFKKIIDFSDNDVVNLQTGEFNVKNHFFSTGEELIYKPNSTFLGVGSSSVGIGLTLNSVGVVTDKLPSTVFAIKINNDIFKLATRKDYANAGIYVTFTSIGEGNAHEIEMSKKNEKTLITIDGVIQSPISYSLLDYNINNGSTLGITTTFIPLSGISSIGIGDLLKIDNEYVKVNNVGLGETILGPIVFSGNVPLVEVTRGFVGTSATTHNDLAVANLYRGSYNIYGNQIFFTEPPKGNSRSNILFDENNLESVKSSFSGRVFLKRDYTSNKVYDDISSKFTGLDETFTLSSQGITTVGLGTTGGNGIVTINGIFQAPTTKNNLSKNYFILEDQISGISSISFTGITSSNGNIVISDYDINRNQLPRGGIIVSLGSTPGLGYAPLVGASVTSTVSSGSIISIGIGTTGSFGSGYRNPVSIAVTEIGHTGNPAIINAIVGSGGTLSFNIIDGGTGYTNPSIIISPPSYENLPVTGVSRISVGSTTDTGIGLLLNVEVGASSTTGIGSTLFEVSSFKISRPGYGFRKGDVFKPVGLVTAYGLTSPVYDFELTVLETFTDSFAAWEFGEIDYIDSIKIYQDGIRKKFPLFYNSKLLSFEKNLNDPDSQLIDYDSNLIIFVNGILQEPKISYTFDGGSTFTFTDPPNPEDEISIFFYRASSEDSMYVEVVETIKQGDNVQLSYNSTIPSKETQNIRTVTNIKSSNTLETILYSEQGIDDINPRPLSWTKQKSDLIIDGNIVSKSRDSIEPQIYPTAKIIKSFSETDNELFVDSVDLFDYENNLPVDGIIISNKNNYIPAEVEVTVSNTGSIDSIIIINPGSGYIGTSVDIKLSLPQIYSGTRAQAYSTVVNGSLSSPVNITNVGSGYTNTVPVYGYVSPPITPFENISNISSIEGFFGNIVGIKTSVGIGTSMGISFTLDPSLSPFVGLSTGYYIYVYDTIIGNGVTSIINNDSQIVGIGTKFVDNVYYINSFDSSVGIITCNIIPTDNVGIGTTGPIVGKISWGRISGFSRSSNPISLGVSSFTVDSELSTFPIIQRRGTGLRNTGSLGIE